MRAAYTLAAVTRLYEAALVRHGMEEVAPAGEHDFEILVRAAAVALEQTGSATKDAHRHELLHDLGASDFVDAHRAAELLFARLGLTVPTPQEFVDAGVDWQALTDGCRSLEAEGSDPQLLVTPMLPLGESSAESAGRSWRDLYALLAADSSIASNPLRARPDGHGLQLGAAVGVDDAIRELSAQETAAVEKTHRSVEDELGIFWNVSVVALADTASQGNVPYLAAAGDHLWPSEYLALQALRIVAGKTPIDQYSWTWLQGVLELDARPHALAGVWVPGYGQIRIYANPVGYAQERLLARTPLRG